MGKITEEFQHLVLRTARVDDQWYHRMLKLMAMMTVHSLFKDRGRGREYK